MSRKNLVRYFFGVIHLVFKPGATPGCGGVMVVVGIGSSYLRYTYLD